jgi:hypothetical protein
MHRVMGNYKLSKEFAHKILLIVESLYDKEDNEFICYFESLALIEMEL